jgi:hypothetical protein
MVENMNTVCLSFLAVQKTILDLVVVLAGYEFRCEEMKVFLKFLQNEKPAWVR